MSWLKFETTTHEKPEVFQITTEMGWDDPDLTVGKLLRVWRWFDEHTVSGDARSVTLPLVDRLIGVTGFAQAMVNVGWLVITEQGLTLPNFDRHNGKTAKDRALTAKRNASYVKRQKSDAESDASTVTSPSESASAREEKRRDITTLSGDPDGVVAEPKKTDTKAQDSFDEFWKAYPSCPRKEAKGKCFEVWKRKNLSANAEQIIAHVRMMASSHDWTKEGRQFVPMPMTYLNQARWDGAEFFSETSEQDDYLHSLALMASREAQ